MKSLILKRIQELEGDNIHQKRNEGDNSDAFNKIKDNNIRIDELKNILKKEE